MDFQKLPREFYLQPTIIVAKQLLGKLFIRRLKGELLIGKIVEVEAYLGEKDPASHSYRGKTERNSVMFEEGGKLYVYFTYGMHFCCNVVTETKNIGCAVLIRGIEPLRGIETMKANRRVSITDSNIQNLSNGPAKICQSFQIGREENGIDLLGNEIFITENSFIKSEKPIKMGISRRIGIREGFGDEKRWRYFVKGSRFVS